MLTVILPTYKNPDYLDLCLKSILDNSVRDDTRVIVSVDGFPTLSRTVLDKHKCSKLHVLENPINHGMGYAINIAAWAAETPYLFIANDDNVFPKEWDSRLLNIFNRNMHQEYVVDDPDNLPDYIIDCPDLTVITTNQIEPSPSIFQFEAHDFGTTALNFKYQEYLDHEYQSKHDNVDGHSRLFPFLVTKKMFMQVGGFDLFYKSPFFVDLDWWLKLELAGCIFHRAVGLKLYHFGSRATKAGNESELFKQSESYAAQQFQYKWGFLPDIMKATKNNNIKSPTRQNIRGIVY